jgi:2-methylcitrate dehydratase PrpD
MLPRPGVTRNLARFIVETKWEDIPEQACHEAKRALLNFFAVAIAGCRTEPVELALKTLAEFSGGRQATIGPSGSTP